MLMRRSETTRMETRNQRLFGGPERYYECYRKHHLTFLPPYNTSNPT